MLRPTVQRGLTRVADPRLYVAKAERVFRFQRYCIGHYWLRIGVRSLR